MPAHLVPVLAGDFDRDDDPVSHRAMFSLGAFFDHRVERIGDSQTERLHEIGLYHLAKSSYLLDSPVVSTR
jgi:hypothetical protein